MNWTPCRSSEAGSLCLWRCSGTKPCRTRSRDVQCNDRNNFHVWWLFARRFGCLLSSFFQAKERPSITSHAAFEKGCLDEIYNVWEEDLSMGPFECLKLRCGRGFCLETWQKGLYVLKLKFHDGFRTHICFESTIPFVSIFRYIVYSIHETGWKMVNVHTHRIRDRKPLVSHVPRVQDEMRKGRFKAGAFGVAEIHCPEILSFFGCAATRPFCQTGTSLWDVAWHAWDARWRWMLCWLQCWKLDR